MNAKKLKSKFSQYQPMKLPECDFNCESDNHSCLYFNRCWINQRVQIFAANRYSTFNYRARQKGIFRTTGDITRLEICELVRESLQNGFSCTYCNCQMFLDRNINDKAITLDHKISLKNGGRNEKSNLVVCCKQCNRIKGCSE